MQIDSKKIEKIREFIRAQKNQENEDGLEIDEDELIRKYILDNLYNDVALWYLSKAAQEDFPSPELLSREANNDGKEKIPITTVRNILKEIKEGWTHEENSIRIIQDNRLDHRQTTDRPLNIDALKQKKFKRFIRLGRICQEQSEKRQSPDEPTRTINLMTDGNQTKPEKSAEGEKESLVKKPFKSVVDHYAILHPTMQGQAEPRVERIQVSMRELQFSCLSALRLVIGLHDFLTPTEVNEFILKKWSELYAERKRDLAKAEA